MARHGYNPLARQRGFVRVSFTDPDGVLYLRLAEHRPLCAALERGDPWYAGIDNFGLHLRFKLAGVHSVCAATPECLAAYLADGDASDREDRTQRDDEDGESWKHGSARE